MKKILIVLGNYSPNPSSVANCISPIIDELRKNYNIDIITDKKRVDIPEYEFKDNINTYRVDDYRVMNTIHSNELKKIKSSKSIMFLTRIFTNILKSIYYFRYTLFAKEQGTGGWEIKRVLNKIIELDNMNNYSIIFTISQPFQSHYIGEKFKELKGNCIKWIVFEFDPYSFNNDIKVSYPHRRRMYIDEKRIFEKSDGVILTPELYNFYKNKNYIDLTSRVYELPFANLEQIKIDTTKVEGDFTKKNRINCIFTGQLYDKIRNPKFLLNIFSAIEKDIQLIMITNFSQDKIKSYVDDDKIPIVIPLQNRDTALYNLMKADILINIGNTVEYQVPGKIFEYMSTGKPIIHFSKIKNDPAIKYLEKYPKVLIVNEWDNNNGKYIVEIEKFCYINRGFTSSFDDVSNKLREYTGDTSKEKFNCILNEILGD